MAALTTARAGNWSDTTGTTPWTALTGSGTGGVPGAGDTITISHAVVCDTSQTFGTSNATPTIECDVTSAGSLTIAAGAVLNAKGNLRITNTTLTLNAGATYEFDSSAAAGTPLYKIVMGTAASEQLVKVIANGSSGSHCTFRKFSGSGNGLIGPFGSGLTAWTQGRFTYTDFTDMGTASTGFDNNSIIMNVVQTSPHGEAYFDHCTFDRCAGAWVQECNAASDLVFTFNRFSNPLNVFSGWFTCTDTTTGLRTVTGNVFPTEVYSGSVQAHKAVLWSVGYKGVTFENNVLCQFLPTSFTGLNAATSFQKNLFATRAAQNTAPITAGVAGDNISNNYFFIDAASGAGDSLFAILPVTNNTTTGNLTFSGNVAETTQPTEDGDFTHLNAQTSGLLTVVATYNIALPNSRGRFSGSFNSHGGKTTNVRYEHNTVMTADNFPPSGSGEAGFGTGSGYDNHAGMFPTVKDNLIWSKNTRNVDGLGFNYIFHSVAPLYSFTADSGTINTLTKAGAAFQTGTNTTLGDAGAIIVITGKTGSGPEVGEVCTITSNTATVITVSPNFSAAPDTGTTFKIHSIDNVTSCLNNAGYNIGAGTINDQTGGNSTATSGYNGLWLTNYATFGNADVSLGTGTDEMTQGPKFVDTTRNIATFDTVYLGNSAADGAWVTSTPYVYGQIVSAATSTWYNNATINYRCILAHTSGSTTKPGSGASWRTNWECASVERIRNATIANTLITDATLSLTNATYIETLTAWVKYGFRPQSVLLHNTASDGTDIGAMPFLASASISSISPSTGAQNSAVPVTITGSGTSFSGSSVVTVSGTGVTVSATNAASTTSITCTLTISPTATASARTVTVTTGAEVVTTTFTVTATIIAPTVSSILPATGVQSTAPSVAVVGANTHFSGSSAVAISGAGVTVSAISSGSATAISFTLTISATAGPGVRTITITTGSEVVTTTFTVTAAAAAAVGMKLYGAAQAGGSLTVISPGERIVLFNGYESPAAGVTSVAFVRGDGPLQVPVPALFTINFAASPTATVLVQGSNTDVEAQYQTLHTTTNTANDFYQDSGEWLYYRVKLSSYSAGGMPIVIAQR